MTSKMPIRRHARRRLQRSEGGMALIEALVSVLIFSFGVLGLIGLATSAINFSVDAEDRSRAALFASDIASWMWLNGTVTVPAQQYSTWQANIKNLALPNALPGGTLSIITTNGTTNSSDIVITWMPTTDMSGTTRQLSTRVIL
jgi:type IV pilus assembly protein PilV